jgi:BlaI family penicillinase repressor
MKELTRAEEQIMHVLWELGKAFVKDIVQRMPEPKPAYNTVSTIVRIMENKGFVSHIAYGNTYEYYPTISKEEYTKLFMQNFVKKYFEDSYQDMVSFFAKDRNLTIGELEDIKNMIIQEIQKQKRDKNG